MLSRGCAYSRVYDITSLSTIPRHASNVRYLPALELRLGFPLRSFFACQWISQRHSHAAAAAEVESKNQQDIVLGHAIRRVKPNEPDTTPSLRFITFDQSQHFVDAKSKGESETERSLNQKVTILPIRDMLFDKPRFGNNKNDRIFVNKLLKDKGTQSYDWRIALSELQKYYIPGKTNKPRDSATFNHAPSLVHTTDSHVRDVNGSNRTRSFVRRVRPRKNCRFFRLARNISPPSQWSEANLAAYVEALAESQSTQYDVIWSMKHRLKGRTNTDDVVAAFDKVFYSSTSQRSLSIEACNTALRFYYNHTMMPKARSLYMRMEDLKMPIPTETFNILLRGSTSQRDLHSFTYLLHYMTRRGFKPNEETWTLFLQVTDSSAVRAVIVRKMAEMNMLDNISVRRDVASHMVRYEIVTHLSGGHDHHSFLDYMDNKYGIGWLSTTAGNRLLNEMAKRKSATESLSLLYWLKEAGFRPDDISMNTLLWHCSPLRRHELSIEILEAFKSHYGIDPGLVGYETLFLQAWRTRLLNFSIVVWRYACIDGAVSRKMQNLVFQSLLSSAPAASERINSNDTVEPNHLSRNETFKKFAGRFVVGVDGPRGVELYQDMDTLKLSPSRRNIWWAQLLLKNGLQGHRGHLLEADLPRLLRQALAMDRTWAVEGLYKKDDWWDLFPRAIAVDVIDKGDYRSGRGTSRWI